MPTPVVPKDEALRRIEAINQALREGLRPPGLTGRGKGAVSTVARRIGMDESSLRRSLDRIKDVHGLEPDWSLYVKGGPVNPPKPEKPRIRVKMPTRVEGERYRVLAIGDAHDSPLIDKERFKWIGRYAAETEPTDIVQIGDFFTLDSLNSHIPNETFSGRLKGTFIDDMASGNEALQTIAAEYDGPARKHVTLGNHEHRLFRFEEQAPEVAGMMQLELHSILERNGWSWTPYGAFYFVGGVAFTHVPLNRLGRAYGGKTSHQQIANDAVFDIAYGHTHIAVKHTVPKLGERKSVTVVNLGCALPDQYVEEYAKHSLAGWSWGITDLTIFDGHIQSANFISMCELAERYG